MPIVTLSLARASASRRHEGEAEREKEAVGAAHGTLRGWQGSLSIAPQDAKSVKHKSLLPGRGEGTFT